MAIQRLLHGCKKKKKKKEKYIYSSYLEGIWIVRGTPIFFKTYAPRYNMWKGIPAGLLKVSAEGKVLEVAP